MACRGEHVFIVELRLYVQYFCPKSPIVKCTPWKQCVKLAAVLTIAGIVKQF